VNLVITNNYPNLDQTLYYTSSVDKISNIDTTATQTRALTTTLATIHNNYSAAAAAACLIYP